MIILLQCNFYGEPAGKMKTMEDLVKHQTLSDDNSVTLQLNTVGNQRENENLEDLKGALDKYNIYLFITTSIESFE